MLHETALHYFQDMDIGSKTPSFLRGYSIRAAYTRVKLQGFVSSSGLYLSPSSSSVYFSLVNHSCQDDPDQDYSYEGHARRVANTYAVCYRAGVVNTLEDGLCKS